jgi:hypothetical protein
MAHPSSIALSPSLPRPTRGAAAAAVGRLGDPAAHAPLSRSTAAEGRPAGRHEHLFCRCPGPEPVLAPPTLVLVLRPSPCPHLTCSSPPSYSSVAALRFSSASATIVATKRRRHAPPCPPIPSSPHCAPPLPPPHRFHEDQPASSVHACEERWQVRSPQCGARDVRQEPHVAVMEEVPATLLLVSPIPGAVGGSAAGRTQAQPHSCAVVIPGHVLLVFPRTQQRRGACRMDLPGPTTSVGTRTDYSVGPWDYPACATRHLMAWSTRTTEEKYSVRKLYMSCAVWKAPRRTRLVLSPYSDL